MSRSDFPKNAKRHMTDYKRRRLGTDACGKWRGNEYSHLLPEDLRRQNILETYRAEFWDDFDSGRLGQITLHPGFHHLTSSQAMCFNLFYPFVHSPQLLPQLLAALEIPDEDVVETAFEKVPLPTEGTSFDFFLRYSSRMQVTFEVKYTESGFGAATDDETHREKFDSVYRPLAEGILQQKACDCPAFLRDYQLLRNLVHLDNDGLCLFIVPAANRHFADIDARLDEVLLPSARERAKVVHIERLLERLLALSQESGGARLGHHLFSMKEKYVL